MNRLTIRIVLIAIILMSAAVAFGSSAGILTSNSSGSEKIGSAQGPAATATYGAEQFQLQLTAIAQPAP